MKRGTRSGASNPADEAADWIVRRDRGFSAADQRAFDRWRLADPRHEEALAQHDQTWSRLDRPRRAGRGEYLLRQLSSRASSRRRRRLALGGVTLGLLLVFVPGWWPGAPSASPDPASALAAAPAFVLPETHTLPDGSVVELNAGAAFTTDFSETHRRILLNRGEAHFQVVTDRDRPFIVVVGTVEVRAVGTAFSVDIGEKRIEVLVTEGRVAVGQAITVNNGAESDATTIATVEAGNRLAVVMGGQAVATAGATVVSAQEMSERLAWRGPRLEFSDTPLVTAVALLNRHASGQDSRRLVIDDPALGDMQISGFFRADNTDTFVRLLEASFGVRAEVRGDTILLRLAR